MQIPTSFVKRESPRCKMNNLQSKIASTLVASPPCLGKESSFSKLCTINISYSYNSRNPSSVMNYGYSISQAYEHDDDDDYYYIMDDDPDESRYIYIFNAILSGTARLNVLLPTATILAFTIFAPLLTDDGKCTTLSRYLMGSFILVLSASCVFFTITDSFRTATGRLYYGVATFRGIWTFNGGRRRPLVPYDYRLRWDDLFHASFSLIAFLTFAGLHNDVVSCYYPNMPRKVTNNVPLVVGFLVSVLFVVFPSRRRGIGYPFLLQRDAF